MMNNQQMIDKKFDEYKTLLEKGINNIYKKEYKKKKDILLALFLMDELDINYFRKKMFNTNLNKEIIKLLEKNFEEWYLFICTFYPAEYDINSTWIDNINYKDRVYRWYYKLCEKIEQVIEFSKTQQDFERNIAKIYRTFSDNLNTLVVTELQHILDETELTWAEVNKVKKFRWITKHDERTCTHCLSRDKRIFTLQELKKYNRHCNCRCSIEPIN